MMMSDSNEVFDTMLSLGLGGASSSSSNVGLGDINNTTTTHHSDYDKDITINGSMAGTRKKLKRTADQLNDRQKKTIDQDTSTNGGSETGTRKKLKPTADQLNVLEHTFNRQKTINQAQKDKLARTLNLAPRQVEIWFQNRRARQKQQETGKEYEITKERYESLMAENKQLKQERQNLLTRSLSLLASTILHIRCPSCASASSADQNNKP